MSEVMKGVVPIIDPNRTYREWLISEVYTGPNGTGKYVPNVDDSIKDWRRGIARVIAVDYSTGLSEWTDWVIPANGAMTQDDLLFGIGPGPDYETWRVMIDTSVIPHLLKIEDRNHTYGENTMYYRVFLGTLTEGSQARVVSANYDAAGHYIGDKIPMELAATDALNNRTIRYPAGGYTNEKLDDGTRVTVVMYGANDIVVSRTQMLVVNTGFIRRQELGQKYITHISLETPFLSDAESNVIDIPINLPKEALALMARVHYSNGSVMELPVNNGKMMLHGLDAFIATIRHQQAPLTLVYQLDDNETAINTENPDGTRHIAARYFIRTQPVIGAYSVKLFVLPRYVDPVTGWRLEYVLYNLDRGDFYWATNFVEPSANSAPFKPNEYGVTQNLSVAVDMDKLDPRLKPYRHVQKFQIALMANGLEDRTPYLLSYNPGQDPEYGKDLSCRLTLHSIGDWSVKIDQGKASLESWLAAVYYPIHPLFDPTTESGPMVPTHFVLNINGQRTEYPVSDWDKTLTSITGGVVGASAMIEWVAKTATSTLQLGASGLKIWHETPVPR